MMLVAGTDNFQFRAVWLRESEPLILKWEWYGQPFRIVVAMKTRQSSLLPSGELMRILDCGLNDCNRVGIATDIWDS